MAFLGAGVFRARQAAMQELMQRLGLDALAFTSADFFQFVTNFATDVQTWERPVVAVVPRAGEPFAILAELSEHHWRYATHAGRLWVKDVAFYAEHPRIGERIALRGDWAGLVAGMLRARGLAQGRIGADQASAPLARAIALLPGAELSVPQAAVRALRFVKHPEEIALMREIASLTDWLQERYRENIRPDRLTLELDMAMAARVAEEAAERFPGQHLEILRCWTISGPASSAPHGDGRTAGARIETGHGLINIVVLRVNGLVVENERTWFCGRPTAEQETLFGAALAANEAAIAAAVTGQPVSGIDAAAQAVIEERGFGGLIRHRTGHGMGTLGHEFPEDMAFNHRPLLEREVYSAEPGIYLYGVGGFRHDDTVVVGTPPEVLTKAPKDLRSQTIL